MNVENKPKMALATEPTTFGAQGIVLQSLDQLASFADMLVASGLAPPSLMVSDKEKMKHGWGPEQVVLANRSKVMIAVQMGAELGLPPMSALQNIAVVNGRPSIWGDAMLGLVRASGKLEWIEETALRESENKDEWGFRVTVKRVGHKPAFWEFTVGDAKKAGLWGSTPTWTKYPDRMLKYRARAFVLRDQFGDILRGLHSTEELQDMEPERNVTPPDFIEKAPAKKKTKCQAGGCRKNAVDDNDFCATHRQQQADEAAEQAEEEYKAEKDPQEQTDLEKQQAYTPVAKTKTPAEKAAELMED